MYSASASEKTEYRSEREGVEVVEEVMEADEEEEVSVTGKRAWLALMCRS